MKTCLFQIILLGAAVISGRSFYVDNQDGLDANNGLALTAAWKTLTKVSNTTLQAGDTVKLKRGGAWKGQTFTVKGAAVENNPIVVTTYGDGDAPKLGGLTGTQGCVNISAAWVIMENLYVSSVPRSAFSIGGQHCVLRSCEACTTGAGVTLSGQYGLVTKCYFHDLIMQVNTPTPTNDDNGATGIWFMNSDEEVSYCRLVRCVDSSYDYKVDGGGVEVWATKNVQNINVHHNYAFRCAGFFEMGGTGAVVSHVNVSYNVLVDCFGLPFIFWNTSGTYAIKVRDYAFDNNTVIVHSCSGENQWACLAVYTLDTVGTFALRNNLFYVYNADRIMSGGVGARISNNLVYHVGTKFFELGFTASATDISGKDPMIKNFGTCAAEGDYGLLPGSPAIDKGTLLGYTADYSGTAVPNGAAPDIGAYEYNPNASVNVIDEPRLMTKQSIRVIKKITPSGNKIVLVASSKGSPRFFDVNGARLWKMPK